MYITSTGLSVTIKTLRYGILQSRKSAPLWRLLFNPLLCHGLAKIFIHFSAQIADCCQFQQGFLGYVAWIKSPDNISAGFYCPLWLYHLIVSICCFWAIWTHLLLKRPTIFDLPLQSTYRCLLFACLFTTICKIWVWFLTQLLTFTLTQESGEQAAHPVVKFALKGSVLGRSQICSCFKRLSLKCNYFKYFRYFLKSFPRLISIHRFFSKDFLILGMMTRHRHQ